jgi:hypothetical protein
MDLLKNNILGKSITKIENIHDYVKIYFNDSGILNLYNKTVFNCEYDLFKDETIKKYKLNKKTLKLYCKENIYLEMSMKEKDYNGPEAFEYNKGTLCIVGRE